MDQDALGNLAKLRAQGDVKLLKKVIKDFYQLVSADVKGEQLQAAHETFLLDLDQFALQLSKTSRLQRVTSIEVAGYESEARAIEQTHAETRETLEALKERLASAQRDRACRIEYDVVAKAIGKLPDRTQGEESKAKLTLDIQVLKEEQKTYADTWHSRQQAFDSIVEALVVMSDNIKDEATEQARRRALEEDDETLIEEITPPTLDPSAKPFEPATIPIPTTADTEMKDSEAVLDPDAMEGIEGGEVVEVVELEEGQEREEKEEGEMVQSSN